MDDISMKMTRGPGDDLFGRRAEFVRHGIPRELSVERVAWARRARSAALFRALAAVVSWPFRRFARISIGRRWRALR
jgi:hypothetical protein